MKSNIILITLTVLFIFSGIFIYQKIMVLETRYEILKESNIRLQLNKPLTSNQIKERQFKEEMYIRQQERDTALILTFFSVFSILVGFFTFRSVRVEFINKLDEINKSNSAAKKEMDNKYIEIAHSYNKLEFELNLELAQALAPLAMDALGKKQPLYYYYKLKSIEKFVKVLRKSDGESLTIKNQIIANMHEQIQRVSLAQLKEVVPNDLKSEMLKMITIISEYLIEYDHEYYITFTQGMQKITFEQ